jgi:transposase
VRWRALWARLLGLKKSVVEALSFDDEGAVVLVRVRPYVSEQGRCPHCGRRCSGYDSGGGLRRWRSLDLGTVQVFIEALAPRVECSEHGVMVAAVPWARHGARYTRAFEDQVAWMATHTDKTTLAQLMRVSWRSVGRIIERVCAETQGGRDLLDGLRRIGIDEVSFRRRHKYLVVVVDHDSQRLVWAREGRERATVDAFFEQLGRERCELIDFVSADAASWISSPVRDSCPNAVLCMDPFHVVQWAMEALDKVRRQLWRELRREEDQAGGLLLQRSRFALWTNPEKLTESQKNKLASIAKLNEPLYRAYLLKEQLREVFHTQEHNPVVLLDAWLAWAQRCRLQPFVVLGQRIQRYRPAIVAALTHRLSNARTEGMNTKIRLLTRLAYGFHSAKALIALAMLKLGGLCPSLPGRT